MKKTLIVCDICGEESAGEMDWHTLAIEKKPAVALRVVSTNRKLGVNFGGEDHDVCRECARKVLRAFVLGEIE